MTDPRRFFPVERFGEIREIVPVTVGQSGNPVYAVATASGDFILRIHAGDASGWDEDLAVQRLASDHGIAPRLVSVDEGARAVVSVKVTGLPFASALADPALRPVVLGSLVDRLATLHALPTAGVRVKNPPEFARSVFEAQARRAGFPSWARPLRGRLEATCGVLASDPRQVVSHCDLNPANVVWDGSRVWLVDWEGSGLAHPYLDLATLANFLSLPDEAATGLLTAQERTPLDERQRGVFAAVRDFARIVYGGVFLSGVPDLTAVTFAPRDETPSLRECFAMMGAGKLGLGEPQGRALIGAALLKQCEPAP